MPFDFNADPVRIYGIWPQTPFPVEVSVYGYCQMACNYCFANRNRDAFDRKLNPVNSTPSLLRKLDRVLADPENPIGFFLRERYPVCFSNTTDPFQREEKRYRSSEAFLQWAKVHRVPIYLQTRGADLLLDEWDRYAPLIEPGRVVVYLSICQMDDADRRRNEPGASKLARRWELAAQLRDHGVPVVAACNPHLKEWIPDPEAYVALCVANGIKGIWLESLHFTDAQRQMLPKGFERLATMANLLPMYAIGELKRWYAATASAGLDFFPTPRWDAYFGHVAKHPECADPSWFGGKTFGVGFRLAKRLYMTSREEGRQTLFGWREIEGALQAAGLPNPILQTSLFWYPFNAQVKADRESWNARLGKKAPLYEILRYFWNHPWESQNFLWYHPLLQGVYNTLEGAYLVDEDGDLTGCFDPRFNKHHGSPEIDHESVNWSEAVWPQFVPG